MKILVHAMFAANTPHFETELEIIQRHLSDGDEVTVVGCNAQVLACDINWSHAAAQCAACIGRRVNGLKRLDRPVSRLRLIALNDAQRLEIAELRERIAGAASLAELRVEDFDLGYGVISSLVSWQRDPELDLNAHRDEAHALAVSALGVYRSMQNHLDAARYDRVYVYNGRYALMRAVLRACQSRGVECCTHERGSTLDRFALWTNTTVHDLENTARLITEAWQRAGAESAALELAHQFYLDRYQGVSRAWVSFTSDHEAGRLPSQWDPTRKNIAIFISSEDEFVAIGQAWKNPLYDSQIEGIRRIAASIADDPRVCLYLRVHPNLKGLDNAQTRALRALDAPNLVVIGADSTISSYALLRNAAQVITFGSTIGIEATYWGVPSILAGRSFYSFLGVTYTPESHEALVALLRADLVAKAREDTLPYGYYWQTFGDRFKDYEATGIYSGRFKGSAVEARGGFLIAAKLFRRARLGRMVTAYIRGRSRRLLGLG